MLRIWAPSDPSPKGRQHEVWLRKILDLADKRPYCVLCANCHFMVMYRNRTGAGPELVQPAVRPVFVWRSGMSLKDLQGARIKWLENKLAAGTRVLVVLEDDRVAEYTQGGVGQVLAKSWPELAQAEGLEEAA